MSATALPSVYLARHGQTAWSLSRQHTGLTDLPLTAIGERDARRLGTRLQRLAFERVLCSPLQRALRTCELAGFAAVAQTDARLLEWDYGEYEGRSSAEVHATRPDWWLFRDGCPGGESPAMVAARADSLVATLRTAQDCTLVFSSGHFLRMLAARWLGLDASGGAHFTLDTASLSILGYEHNLHRPVLRLWNDVSHVEA